MTVMRVDIILDPNIASHLSNSKSTPVYNELQIIRNSFPICKYLVPYEEGIYWCCKKKYIEQTRISKHVVIGNFTEIELIL